MEMKLLESEVVRENDFYWLFQLTRWNNWNKKGWFISSCKLAPLCMSRVCLRTGLGYKPRASGYMINKV